VLRPALRPAALAVLAAVLAAGCSRGGAPDGAERYVAGGAVVTYVSTAERERAPDLAGETLTGGSLDLAVARAGGVAVVNVWGAWCVPCREEQPHLERAFVSLRPRGVAFVGVDIRDEKVAASRHVQRYGVTYPSLFDPSARLLTRFETVPKSPPATYVVDRSGRVAAYAFGVLDEAALVALVERVLGE
jgi:thiol-disulfide isomerase/thioredoxin